MSGECGGNDSERMRCTIMACCRWSEGVGCLGCLLALPTRLGGPVRSVHGSSIAFVRCGVTGTLQR